MTCLQSGSAHLLLIKEESKTLEGVVIRLPFPIFCCSEEHFRCFIFLGPISCLQEVHVPLAPHTRILLLCVARMSYHENLEVWEVYEVCVHDVGEVWEVQEVCVQEVQEVCDVCVREVPEVCFKRYTRYVCKRYERYVIKRYERYVIERYERYVLGRYRMCSLRGMRGTD